MSTYDMITILVTPIYVISTYWVAISILGEQVYNKKAEILSYILFGIIITSVYFLIKTPIVVLAVNNIGIFLITLNYSTPILNKISCTLTIFFVAFIAEIIVWRGLGFTEINFFENNVSITIVGLVIARVLVFILAYFMFKYKKSKVKNFPIPSYYYFSQILILLGILYLYIFTVGKGYVSMTQVLISSTILILVNVMIIFIDEKIYENMIVNNERILLKQQNIAYENQTKIIDQSLIAIQSIKHDMKNHIITLNSMYDNNKNEDIKVYITKMLNLIDSTNQLVQSNNFIIDSIVNFKLQELANLNVNIKIDVKVPHQLNILAYDLTTILGNLLDNTLTALKQIPQSKDRKLDLSMYCNKGNLIILIDNSFDGKVSMQNGKYKTTKAIKSNHGMGLQNVEETIATYGGNIQTEHTDDTFSVAVLIPYTD